LDLCAELLTLGLEASGGQALEMQRREFITMISGAAVASWPVAITAAQEIGKTYHIAYLGSGSSVASGRYAEGFVDALHGLGFVEGKNTIFRYRWAEGKFDQLPALASEIVRDRPDVIVGLGGTLVASAIKSATSTLPAVILTDDPVAEGLVASLARPGGNLTGVSVLQEKAELKRIQLLRDTLPRPFGLPS
jgi:putative ABC transport system substrate-binding protein